MEETDVDYHNSLAFLHLLVNIMEVFQSVWDLKEVIFAFLELM